MQQDIFDNKNVLFFWFRRRMVKNVKELASYSRTFRDIFNLSKEILVTGI